MVGRPFQKGVSGNPGGKPKLPEDIVALARSASPAILQRLIDFATGKRDCEPQVQIRAAEAVLNRAWGTPRQSVDVTAEGVTFVMRLPSVSSNADEWAAEAQKLNGGSHD